MRKLVLAIALLVAIPVMLVGCAKSQVPAVKDDINGFVTAYNDGDLEKCTDYLLGITDQTKDVMKGDLALYHQIGGNIEVSSVKDVKIDKSTATASVTLTTMGKEPTIEFDLTKEDGTWKFSWTAVLATLPQAQVPAVKDSINGFVAALNGGDYEKCTDYLVGITDENSDNITTQLKGLKEQYQLSIEVVSIEEISVDGSSATAKVTLKVTFMGQTMEQPIVLPLTKVDGTWKFSFGELLASLTQ